MPKKSISVTLEEATIDSLRTLADEEMRSVSNLIDYIVAQYANQNGNSAYAKLNRAAQFGRSVRIGSFSETQNALMKNVYISESDSAKPKPNGENDA